MKVLSYCLALLVSSCLWLVNVPTAHAQSFFDNNRQFTITQACDATTSIRSGSNPVPLNVGESYTALGENKSPGGTHAFILVDDDRKWVSLSCGEYDGGPIVIESEFSPFFDNEDNPRQVGFGGVVDITPPAPVLNDFDRDVVATCGELGKEVSKDEFKAMMQRHPDVLENIKDYVGGEVFHNSLPQMDNTAFLNTLTEAWFNDAHGFDHIFCSEPESTSRIGGLHFHGRYLQLQEDGLAGILDDNESREEVDPGVIYTLGVEMKVGDSIFRDQRKGYGLTLSAEDIFKLATKAFRDNPTNSTQSVGCLLDVNDDDQQFKAVFVRRSYGVRTFYPDATPNGGDRFNPPCKIITPNNCP
ncbi:MAG: EndoU domain-containing protein [Leptolyngbya sp. SIO3F4]|nr:EndoU domain-containing protein [Leptolyngbya sp. SIO3F4]